MWEQNHSGTVFSATNDFEESIIQIAIFFSTSKEKFISMRRATVPLSVISIKDLLWSLHSFVLRKTDIFAEGTGGTG